jgi:metal-responsive CopG/Arc/MetJ family transcriptional regulator
MDKIITFNIPKELHKRFEKVTKDKGINRSFILRLLFEKWIKEQEKEVNK